MQASWMDVATLELSGQWEVVGVNKSRVNVEVKDDYRLKTVCSK